MKKVKALAGLLVPATLALGACASTKERTGAAFEAANSGLRMTTNAALRAAGMEDAGTAGVPGADEEGNADETEHWSEGWVWQGETASPR